MKLIEWIDEEIAENHKLITEYEKHIYRIRHGLDLEDGETRDAFTIKTLCDSKNDSIKFVRGSIKMLEKLRARVAK
ncbi:MAG: hypothetical protein ACRDCE_17255 [Cetobacterium sp.]|uniref:hypothetical protein n=1 Tax=Cetobacterium sp. TaxID=2071632 RepID=UPI003EE4EBA5